MEKPQIFPEPEFHKRVADFRGRIGEKFKKHPKTYLFVYSFLFVFWFLFEDYLAEKGRAFVSEHMGKALPFMSGIYHWLVASGLGIFGLTTLLFTLILIGHAYWETRPKKKEKSQKNKNENKDKNLIKQTLTEDTYYTFTIKQESQVVPPLSSPSIFTINQAAPSLSPSIIFAIEYIEQEFLWRAEGETEMHSILPDPPTPKEVALFLRVKARITAIPALHVEEVRLEIEGPYDPPLLIDWQPQKVSPPHGLERSFHFEISRSIPFMSHAMKLYARAWDDKNQKNIESTSQIFDVEIRRHARAIE